MTRRRIAVAVLGLVSLGVLLAVAPLVALIVGAALEEWRDR